MTIRPTTPSTIENRAWPSVELPHPLGPRPEISHVLFDFDGTLSLIRQGWPEVMVPMFVEAIPRQPGETEDAIRAMVLDDIMRLNGKQTIYQMIQLAERIRERGGQPREPLWYKHEYLRRLENGNRRPDRRPRRADRSHPTSLLVHAARPLLEHLRDRGLAPLPRQRDRRTRRQARGRAARHHPVFRRPHLRRPGRLQEFSKKMVIDRILAEHGITGRQLLAFGDGYVEIENTKQVGGLAVAVASDEANNGSGRVDEWKRHRLLGVGADAVIPDFRDAIPFVNAMLER